MRFGLTGGIGSGKSTVARQLASRGVSVVDADVLARRVVEPDSEGWHQVVTAFGPTALRPDRQLDRAAIARRVFEDPSARATLNAIVHPLVKAEAVAEFGALARAGVRWAVYDVPLLYESGLESEFQEVVVVWAPEDVRRARLRRRDGLTDEQISGRLRAQMPLEEKRARADQVIDNGGALAATEKQVTALFDDWCARFGPPAD